MYCQFFGLRAPPFNNTPDPAFYFNTPEHEEALASLLYAVQQHKGFVLLTGEIGAGKTLLSRLLLQQLHATARTAVVTNTQLSAPELLNRICREFGLPAPPEPTKGQRLQQLEQFLLDCHAAGQTAVLILDEAQNLPDDALEELRMLGNFEADHAKLLQVLLLGQPELRRRLAQRAMLPLRQRLFRAFHLGRLTRTQTADYIQHRLHVAAAQNPPPFEPDAYDLIFRHSAGLPRMINQLCDAALLTAYARSQRSISAQIIQQVAEESAQLQPAPTSADPAEPPPPQPAPSHVEERLQQIEAAVQCLSDLAKQQADPHQPAQQTAEQITHLSEEFGQRERSLAAQLQQVAHQAGQALSAVQQLERRRENAPPRVAEPKADKTDAPPARVPPEAAKLLAEISQAEGRAMELIVRLGQTGNQASLRISQLAQQAERAERLTASMVRITEAAARRISHLQEHLNRADQIHDRVQQDLALAEQTAASSRKLVADLCTLSTAASQQIESGKSQLRQIQATINAAEVASGDLGRQMAAATSAQALDAPAPIPQETAMPPEARERLTAPHRSPSRWPIGQLLNRLRH